jgi:hypothetical protein
MFLTFHKIVVITFAIQKMMTAEPMYYYVPATEMHLQAEHYWTCNYFNSDTQIHTILLKLQKYYATPNSTCFVGPYWPIIMEHIYLRQGVQRFHFQHVAELPEISQTIIYIIYIYIIHGSALEIKNTKL